jgi:Uma2 family endonuclease
MPHVPDTAYFPLAPDWLCEIISPSTARLDRAQKLAVYAREGVSHAWLLDPLARTLEVLRLAEGRWTIVATHAGADLVRAEPFDAIEFTLSEFWAE